MEFLLGKMSREQLWDSGTPPPTTRRSSEKMIKTYAALVETLSETRLLGVLGHDFVIGGSVSSLSRSLSWLVPGGVLAEVCGVGAGFVGLMLRIELWGWLGRVAFSRSNGLWLKGSVGTLSLPRHTKALRIDPKVQPTGETRHSNATSRVGHPGRFDAEFSVISPAVVSLERGEIGGRQLLLSRSLHCEAHDTPCVTYSVLNCSFCSRNFRFRRL